MVADREVRMARLDHLADASAKAISNIKFDKVVVWENGGQNGRSNTADFLHKMAGTLPPMLHVMRDIGGVEIPDSLAKLVGEDGTKVAAENGSVNGAERDEASEEEVASTAAAKSRV